MSIAIVRKSRKYKKQKPKKFGPANIPGLSVHYDFSGLVWEPAYVLNTYSWSASIDHNALQYSTIRAPDDGIRITS